ncbi:hypothetical protein HK101_009700 [Irineochytrium annulatum]|nr:hypothetical protein HK101_009700 [Irineochytrium annulatum]
MMAYPQFNPANNTTQRGPSPVQPLGISLQALNNNMRKYRPFPMNNNQPPQMGSHFHPPTTAALAQLQQHAGGAGGIAALTGASAAAAAVTASQLPMTSMVSQAPWKCEKHASSKPHHGFLSYRPLTDSRLASAILNAYESLCRHGLIAGAHHGGPGGAPVVSADGRRRTGKGVPGATDGREMYADFACYGSEDPRSSSYVTPTGYMGMMVSGAQQTATALTQGLRRSQWIVYIVSEASLDVMVARTGRGMADPHLAEMEEGLQLERRGLTTILPIFIGRSNPDGSRSRFSQSYRERAQYGISAKVKSVLASLFSAKHSVRFAGSVENMALEILRHIDPEAYSYLTNFPPPQMTPYLSSTHVIRPVEFQKLSESIKIWGYGVIAGGPNVGKTLLASQYALAHRAKYSHVLWISCKSQDDVVDSFALLVRELCPEVAAGATTNTPFLSILDELERPVLQWLQSSSTYLLILDGPRDKSFLRSIFHDIKNFHGNLIIISEDPTIADALNLKKVSSTMEDPSTRVVFLRDWGKAESRAMLGYYSTQEIDVQRSIDWLAKRIKNSLPCALTLAYMASENVTVGEVMRRVQKVEEMMEEPDENGVRGQAPSYLNIIFHLAISTLVNGGSAGSCAMAILDVVAFTSPQHAVPIVPFATAAVFGGDPDLYHRALQLLEDKNLVQRQTSFLGPSLTCHTTVRKLVRARDLSRSIRASIGSSGGRASGHGADAAGAMVTVDTADDRDPLDKLAELLSVGYEAIDSGPSLQPGSKQDVSYRHMMLDHILDGCLSIRVALRDNAGTLDADSKGWRMLDAALHELALRTVASGQRQHGDMALDLLLTLQSHVHGTRAHESVANTLDTMAWRSTELGDPERARELHEQCLTACAGHYGTRDHVSVARQFASLAALARGDRDLANSRAYSEAALATFARVHGTWEHMDVVNTLGILAAVSREDGDTDAARRYLLRVVEILDGMFGEELMKDTGGVTVGGVDSAFTSTGVHVNGGGLWKGNDGAMMTARKVRVKVNAALEELEAQREAKVILDLARRRVRRKNATVKVIALFGDKIADVFLQPIIPPPPVVVVTSVDEATDMAVDNVYGGSKEISTTPMGSPPRRFHPLSTAPSPMITVHEGRVSAIPDEMDEENWNEEEEEIWDEDDVFSLKVGILPLLVGAREKSIKGPLQQMDAIDTSRNSSPRGRSRKKPRARDPAVPPRPRNSFILYRIDKQHEIFEERKRVAQASRLGGGGSGKESSLSDNLAAAASANPLASQILGNENGADYADLGKLIGEMWRRESPEVKALYQKRAEEGRIEHKRVHPNYKYNMSRSNSVGPDGPDSRPGSALASAKTSPRPKKKKVKLENGEEVSAPPSRVLTPMPMLGGFPVEADRHAEADGALEEVGDMEDTPTAAALVLGLGSLRPPAGATWAVAYQPGQPGVSILGKGPGETEWKSVRLARALVDGVEAREEGEGGEDEEGIAGDEDAEDGGDKGPPPPPGSSGAGGGSNGEGGSGGGKSDFGADDRMDEDGDGGHDEGGGSSKPTNGGVVDGAGMAHFAAGRVPDVCSPPTSPKKRSFISPVKSSPRRLTTTKMIDGSATKVAAKSLMMSPMSPEKAHQHAL